MIKIIEKMLEKHRQKELKRLEDERLLRQQKREQEAKAEEQRLEQLKQEELRLEEERKKHQEQLKQDRPKILAITAPLDYIVELETECEVEEFGTKYRYPRHDFFVCNVPKVETIWPANYLNMKFKKISGEDIGEVFTSVSKDKIKFVDAHGNEYKTTWATSLLLSNPIYNYTIEDLNKYIEKLNKELKSKCSTRIENRNDEKIKNDLFNL